MKLVIVFGAGAVGKMTVGQELAKRTGLRLFHNHMTIEPVIEIFGYYSGKITNRLRQIIFEEFAATDLYGMIFTYMWGLDDPNEWEYVKKITDLFENHGGETYYVELVADLEERLKRNKTENRLANKASKRDLAFAEESLLNGESKYRLESREGEIPFKNYLKIDNTHLPAAAAAKQIQEYFCL